MGRERQALHLYEAHRAALVAYAVGITGSRAVAEDVVQDAWLKVRLADPAHPLERPLNYLYRVVRNLAIDDCRRVNRHVRRVTDDLAAVADVLPSNEPSPETAALASNELRHVLAAMAELPERTRSALILHRVEGRTLKEVAMILGISIGLAHSLVRDGVKHCAVRLPGP